MRTLFIIFAFFLLLAFCSAFSHPVHVSITTVEYQPEKKGFVVAIKVFYDDMNLTVFNIYKENLNFVSSKRESEKKCNNYILSAFEVSINNKEQSGKMKFAYSTINEDALWMYYVIPWKEKINEIDITSRIFSEMYPDQKNLVIVKVNDVEKGFSLSRDESECEVKI